MRLRRLRLGSRGMTLVEVLIALAIISIALLGMCLTSLSVIKGNATNDMLTRASTVAQAKMEDLKNVPFSSLANGNDTEGDFTRQWTITDISATLKQITLITSWTNKQGTTSNITIYTLRSK